MKMPVIFVQLSIDETGINLLCLAHILIIGRRYARCIVRKLS